MSGSRGESSDTLIEISGAGQRSVISLNTSAAATSMRLPERGEPVAHALAKRRQLLVVERLHRRLELALVRLERIELGLHRRADVLDVVGHVGLEQQQRARPVRR